LDKIAVELSQVLNNYQKDEFLLDLGGYKFKIKPGRTYIMGIVNLTPDSFSGDGFSLLPEQSFFFDWPIIKFIEQMIKDGADIIDVGGESTRPNARIFPLRKN